MKSKDFFRDKINPYFESIESNSLAILQLPVNGKPFNPFKYTNYALKQNLHIGAVDESLKAYVKAHGIVKNPWAYCYKITRAKSPIYNERQHIEKHIKVMDEFKAFVDSSEQIRAITERIGNIWI